MPKPLANCPLTKRIRRSRFPAAAFSLVIGLLSILGGVHSQRWGAIYAQQNRWFIKPESGRFFLGHLHAVNSDVIRHKARTLFVTKR
jgi:hypothetical protein